MECTPLNELLVCAHTTSFWKPAEYSGTPRSPSRSFVQQKHTSQRCWQWASICLFMAIFHLFIGYNEGRDFFCGCVAVTRHFIVREARIGCSSDHGFIQISPPRISLSRFILAHICVCFVIVMD